MFFPTTISESLLTLPIIRLISSSDGAFDQQIEVSNPVNDLLDYHLTLVLVEGNHLDKMRKGDTADLPPEMMAFS